MAEVPSCPIATREGGAASPGQCSESRELGATTLGHDQPCAGPVTLGWGKGCWTTEKEAQHRCRGCCTPRGSPGTGDWPWH